MEQLSLVYLDGFDAFFSTELAEMLLERLKKFSGTQVILTAHNTDLLSNRLLRPDCYYVLNGRGLNQLTELTGRELRQGHNLQKLYNAGEFLG